jgi:hypothetical protein
MPRCGRTYESSRPYRKRRGGPPRVPSHGPSNPLRKCVPFSAGGPPAISLDQLLAAWTDTGCFDADVTGRESIAGREAHVVTVTPAKECPTTRKPLKRATLWIDVENHFPLKSTYEGETSAETSSLEVAVFETFGSLPDSTFEYFPPADGTIIEVSTPGELKQALAGPVVVPRGSHVILDGPTAVEVTPVAGR